MRGNGDYVWTLWFVQIVNVVPSDLKQELQDVVKLLLLDSIGHGFIAVVHA